MLALENAAGWSASGFLGVTPGKPAMHITITFGDFRKYRGRPRY